MFVRFALHEESSTSLARSLEFTDQKYPQLVICVAFCRAVPRPHCYQLLIWRHADILNLHRSYENEIWNLVSNSSREIILDQPNHQQIDGVPHIKVVLERLVHWTCCPDNGMSDITRLRHVPLTALLLHPRSTDKTNNQLQSLIPPLSGSSQGGQTSLLSPGRYVITF